MALPPQSEDAFLREVDEELRLDQMHALWRRYGRLLVVLLFVGLTLFGGWLWWQDRQEKAAIAHGETFSKALDALESGRVGEGDAALKSLAAEDGNYGALARMAQASRMIEKGDASGAVRVYDAVSRDEAVAEPIRNAAVVRGALLQFDTLAPDKLIERLKPLAVPGNAWFGSAGEMTALAWLKRDRPDKAVAMLRAVAKDKDVPKSIRGRTERLADSLEAAPRPAPAGAGKE